MKSLEEKPGSLEEQSRRLEEMRRKRRTLRPRGVVEGVEEKGKEADGICKAFT